MKAGKRHTIRQPCPSGPKDKGQRAKNRCAFTLVELLVTVAIILVLITLTIVVANITMAEDRVIAGASQVQAYLEGARDRAIQAKAPRGVRFLLEPNVPGTVRSMVFVGPPEVFTDGTVTINPDSQGRPRLLIPSQPAVWNTLYQRKLLVNGARISILDQFYTLAILENTATTPASIAEIHLTRDFINTGSVGQPLDYQLHLAPAVLPNQEPRMLPDDIVVHLYIDRTGDGFYNPNASPPETLVSQIPTEWVNELSPAGGGRLDIMFSPRGTVIGAPASKGVIHFVLADVVDVTQGRTVGRLDKEGNERIVTLVTRTGSVFVANVDNTADADSDGIADDPFRYAETGVEAK